MSSKLDKEKKDKTGNKTKKSLDDANKSSDDNRSNSPKVSSKKVRKSNDYRENSVSMSSTQSPVSSPGSVRFEGSSSNGLSDASSNLSREKISGRSSSAGPNSSKDSPNLSRTSTNLAREDSQDEAEALVRIVRDFVSQISPPLTHVVRRNQELRSQLNALLKSSKTEEQPFQALFREKQELAKSYDSLLRDFDLLRQEFAYLRTDYNDLNVSHSNLKKENASLREIIQSLEATLATKNSQDMVSISPSRVTDPVAAPIAQTSTKRDNVAELEQSILEMEEDLVSPRGLFGAQNQPYYGSITNQPRTPNSAIASSPSRKLTTKSLSNDHKHSNQTIISTSASSPSTTRNINNEENVASPRGKAPPSRAISAPDSSSKISSTISPDSTMMHAKVASPSKPASPMTPPPSNKDSTPSKHTAEDREEQRLAKYIATSRGRSSPGIKLPIKNHSDEDLRKKSKAPTSTFLPNGGPLSQQEQSSFCTLFRKYDINDDDIIDRHEFELVIDGMRSVDQLREVYEMVSVQYARMDWNSLDIRRSASVSLSSALAYVSDCKSGSTNPALPFVKV